VTKNLPCFKTHVKHKHNGGHEQTRDDSGSLMADDYLPPGDTTEPHVSDTMPLKHTILSAALSYVIGS